MINTQKTKKENAWLTVAAVTWFVIATVVSLLLGA
jgi:hypothetical protein